MSRLNALSIAIFLTLAASLTLSACGGGGNPKLLPGATASQLTAHLDEVKTLAAEENCIGAEIAAAQVSEEIDALEGVDAKLKQALVQGSERLKTVVADCEEGGLESEEATREAEEEAERAAEEEGEELEKEGKPHKPEAGGQEEEAEENAPAEGNEGKQPTPPAKGGEEGGSEEPPAEEGGGAPGSGGIGPGAPVGGEG